MSARTLPRPPDHRIAAHFVILTLTIFLLLSSSPPLLSSPLLLSSPPLLSSSPAPRSKEQLTEHPVRFFVGEIVREKIFERFRQEVPYSCQARAILFCPPSLPLFACVCAELFCG